MQIFIYSGKARSFRLRKPGFQYDDLNIITIYQVRGIDYEIQADSKL